ncbi:hypothetical protein COOONC_02095 [Cooperia oncophora]
MLKRRRWHIVYIGSKRQPCSEVTQKILHEALTETMATLREVTFYRFYHVFRKGELESIVSLIPSLNVVHSSFEHGNWCVVVEKVNNSDGNADITAIAVGISPSDERGADVLFLESKVLQAWLCTIKLQLFSKWTRQWTEDLVPYVCILECFARSDTEMKENKTQASSRQFLPIYKHR